MNLTKVLYRNSVFFFGFFLVGAFLAFWPQYLSQILDDTDIHHHVHGALMTVWLVMLISQGFLIRCNRRGLHRQIGRLSCILAPAVFLSMIVIRHHANAAVPNLMALAATLLGAVPLFALAYGLAIYHRRDPATHAGYMLCTPLPMASPIFDRILVSIEAPLGLVEPALFSLVLSTTYVLLAGLTIWDWRAHRRVNVFPVMLAAHLLLYGVAFAVYDSQWWASFGRSFSQWPLS